MSFRPIPMNDLKHSQVFFLLKVPKGGLFFLWILVALLVGTVLFSLLASVEEWSRGVAILRPLEEVTVVRNEITGRVVAKHVEHGQHVQTGQALWSIDTEVMQAEKRRIELELERLIENSREAEIVLHHLSEGLQLEGYTEDAQTAVEFLTLQYKQLKVQSQVAYDAYKREDSKPASLRRSDLVEDLYHSWQLRDLAERQFIPQELLKHRDLMQTYESRYAELQKALLTIEENLSQATVSAPVSGTVEYIRDFTSGEFLSVGEELMRIVPAQADRFRLIVEVSEREASGLEVGQELVMRFSGFPASEYGSVRGIVTYVPKDSERSAGGEFVYRIRGELVQTSIRDRDGRDFPLRPGMTATTRIITRKTPVYRLILRKLDVRL